LSAFAERRSQDVEKLKELQALSQKRVNILRTSGNPVCEIELELHYKTAPSNSYPTKVQDITRVSIQLPSRYPFQEPIASISTPVFHPNVYSSGKICLGTKWLPTEGLDLLVKRIIQIITYDPSILNAGSPANRVALSWYQSAKPKYPSAFPTDVAQFINEESSTKIKWNDVHETRPANVIVSCPSCNAKLRLSAGKVGTVKCPTCSTSFEART
jgi:predicted Zn finger-like uncharacterized protein